MRKFLWALLFLGLVGCATITTNLYDENLKFPPTVAKNIKVFKEPPDREVIKIGEATVDQASLWGEVEDMLRAKAAELGGDAVYIIDSKTSGDYLETAIVATGVIVKYKENVAQATKDK